MHSAREQGKVGTPQWRGRLAARAAASAARLVQQEAARPTQPPAQLHIPGQQAAAGDEDNASVCSRSSTGSLLHSARRMAALASPARAAAAQQVGDGAAWEGSSVGSWGSVRSSGAGSAVSLAQGRLASHHRAVQRAMRGVNAQLYRSGAAAAGGGGRGFVLTPQRPQGVNSKVTPTRSTGTCSDASCKQSVDACCQTSPPASAPAPGASGPAAAPATPPARSQPLECPSAASAASIASAFTEVSDISSASDTAGEPECISAGGGSRAAQAPSPALGWGAARGTAPASAVRNTAPYGVSRTSAPSGPSVAFLAARALAERLGGDSSPPAAAAASTAQRHRSLMARAAALMHQHRGDDVQRAGGSMQRGAADPGDATAASHPALLAAAAASSTSSHGMPMPSAPPAEWQHGQHVAGNLRVDPSGMRQLLRAWADSPTRPQQPHLPHQQQYQQQHMQRQQQQYLQPPPQQFPGHYSHTPVHSRSPLPAQQAAQAAQPNGASTAAAHIPLSHSVHLPGYAPAEAFDWEVCALLNPASRGRGEGGTLPEWGRVPATHAPAPTPTYGQQHVYAPSTAVYGLAAGTAPPAFAHPPAVPRVGAPQRVRQSTRPTTRRRRSKAPSCSVRSTSSHGSTWSRIPLQAAAQLSTEQLLALSSASLRQGAGQGGPARSRKVSHDKTRTWR